LSERASSGPCVKAILAIFGTFFLIALLSVPVTTRTSQDRQAPQSNIFVRTTYPRNTTMFLPGYLSAKARPHDSGNIRVRAAQWIGTMAIALILGIFDYLVFCRMLRRRPSRALKEP